MPAKIDVVKRAPRIERKDGDKPSDLLMTEEVAEILGMKQSWLEVGRHRGYGPPFIRFHFSVRYRRADVEKWLEDQRFSKTSEYSAEFKRTHRRGGRPRIHPKRKKIKRTARRPRADAQPAM